MDKYEFSIKAEQIKKLSGQGDYKTAMQIADTIDWNRVRNANLLSSIAEIYEKNGEYEEAKDILLLAFERAPVGKRFLYKLSELSLSSGAIDDAVEFYREFMDVSPEDPRKFLLQYMILKAKGARAEQLVGPLEQFTETELEEQWLYELAKLYGEAGREDDCVRTCDKMILLFGMGKYVDKAMDLKLHYRPLKEEEAPRTIVKEEYNEEPKTVVQETLVKADSEEGYLDEDMEEDASELPKMQQIAPEEGNVEQPSFEEEQVSVAEEKQDLQSDDRISLGEAEPEKANLEEATTKASSEPAVESASIENEPTKGSFPNYHMIVEAKTIEEAFHIAVEEIKYFHKEHNLNFKVAKVSADKLNEKGFAVFADKLQERDLIIEHAGKLKYSVLDEIEEYILHPKDASSVVLIDEVDHFDRLAEDRPKFIEYFDIVSDHEEEEDDLLEEVDLEKDSFPEEESAEKALYDEEGEEESEEEYLDEPEDAEEPEEYVPHKPSIFERPARPYTEVLEEANKENEEEEEEEILPTVREDRKAIEEDVRPAEKATSKSASSMDIEEFADYAINYAKSIDCSITEKGITALYERIQLMEEDGIVLNEESARDLIEDTADQAEKPSIGKKIGSLFRPKYDKDDKLILREEHFMG
ncbi:MAG: tetratricopeptide repeat protein [Oribacterium parvum]|uniref:tetratricopeptide repeat protein n=1 Tax=Oribacterium parvum TaxID=1501329 RepID=UPI001CB16D04|nr:tetratricopeptide repeat protein [Oribacterium parvum]MBF1268045.1 tetratricopeptide repeat protein [Oribacterium parvum]